MLDILNGTTSATTAAAPPPPPADPTEIQADAGGSAAPTCVFPGQDYPPPDMPTEDSESVVPSVEACAAACAARMGCAAAVFLSHRAGAPVGSDTCYLKAAATVQPGGAYLEPTAAPPGDIPRELIVMAPCSSIPWAQTFGAFHSM